MTLAAFDFDGTLTTRDSMWAFLHFYRGTRGFVWRILWLFPRIVGFKLGFSQAQSTKEHVLNRFLKGEPAEKIWKKGKDFTSHMLPGILRKEAIQRLQWHQKQGHRCYLVTASLSFWTQDFAEENGLTLVATLPEIQEGIFTGKIEGRNCKGKEKVKRLEEAIGTNLVTESYAYGDTAGDRELLAWADHSFFKKFS